MKVITSAATSVVTEAVIGYYSITVKFGRPGEHIILMLTGACEIIISYNIGHGG